MNRLFGPSQIQKKKEMNLDQIAKNHTNDSESTRIFDTVSFKHKQGRFLVVGFAISIQVFSNMHKQHFF